MRIYSEMLKVFLCQQAKGLSNKYNILHEKRVNSKKRNHIQFKDKDMVHQKVDLIKGI